MAENNITQENNRWRLWFSVFFSLFIVVTFVYYLPLRFQWGVLHHDAGEMMSRQMDEHMMDEHAEGGIEGGEHDETIYHGAGETAGGLTVNMEISPTTPDPLRAATLDFFVSMEEAGISRPIQSVQELEEDHGKFMHVIGVRSDLNYFFHIHPEPPDPATVYGATGIFQSAHVFGAPGRYKIWSEIKKAGKSHIFEHPDVYAGGAGKTENKQVSFVREVILGKYKVAFQTQEPVVAGRTSELHFRILESSGGTKPVPLENYLEAPMHLAIIKDDLKRMIHAHPEAGHGHASFLPKAFAHGMEEDAMEGMTTKENGELHFAAVFPETGLYKIFAQFRPAEAGLKNDETLLASFWLNVEEEKGQPIAGSQRTAPGKILYVLVSAIFMIGLSLGVRRFLGTR